MKPPTHTRTACRRPKACRHPCRRRNVNHRNVRAASTTAREGGVRGQTWPSGRRNKAMTFYATHLLSLIKSRPKTPSRVNVRQCRSAEAPFAFTSARTGDNRRSDVCGDRRCLLRGCRSCGREAAAEIASSLISIMMKKDVVRSPPSDLEAAATRGLIRSPFAGL